MPSEPEQTTPGGKLAFLAEYGRMAAWLGFCALVVADVFYNRDIALPAYWLFGLAAEYDRIGKLAAVVKPPK